MTVPNFLLGPVGWYRKRDSWRFGTDEGFALIRTELVVCMGHTEASSSRVLVWDCP